MGNLRIYGDVLGLRFRVYGLNKKNHGDVGGQKHGKSDGNLLQKVLSSIVLRG